jgi:hypothetical protein
MNLGPEPFDGCRRILAQTIAKVNTLTPKPDDIAVADAYSPISNHMVEVLGDMQSRLGAPAVRTLQNLLKQSPSQIVESVRTYFLVPFQRLILGFKPNSLRVQSLYELPKDIADKVNSDLDAHLSYLNTMQKTVKGYTELKLKQAQKQLTALLQLIQDDIRAQLIPGGVMGVNYLVAGLIAGVLGEFINPNIIPDGVSGTGGSIEATARVPINILEVCLSRLQLEGLALTEDEIRDLIAYRNDSEKVLFVTRQDKMTPEEKKSDRMMQRLGLGSWAIGGTKAVSSLNPDMLELEREQRLEMGLGDFALDPDAIANAAALLNEDAYGGGGLGAEGGYDMDQTAADDY